MTVEELEIQIRDNSESAVRGLDALAATLGKLKTVTSGLGLSGISRQIAAISSAAQSTPNDAGSKMQSLAKGLSALSTLGQLKVSPAVANQIRNLGSAAQSLNGVSFAPITQLSSALSSLGGIGRTNLTPTFNQLSKLPQIAAELKTVDFDGFTANVQRLSSALLPLSTMRGSGIGSVISQLGKLPAVAKQLKTLDFDDFARDIQRVTAALAPLSAQLTRVSGSLSSMSPAFRQASAAMNNVSARTSSGTRSFGLFGSGAFGASLRLGVLILAVRRLASVLSDMIDQSNKYIENLNLFTVAMRNGAAEAQSFAEHVSDLMGIDPSDWMRNQGVFNTLATGFGVAADRAAIMSKNLTQLGYDISSFFNISVEDSMQKLQSGIAGELEPLRRLGYDLSQAKLEATALALGIDQSVSSMNQAQKAQLRYYAIMTQVTQAQGDMARTLTSPANQLRILQASFTQCARAIGNIFIPILNAVIPVAIAVVKVITMVANAIASLFGFSLPTVDYSGVSSGFGDIAAGAGDAADAMGGAADAAKALKRATVGLDELNILQTNNDTGGGGGGAGGAGGGGGNFDFDLPQYDFLAGLINTKTDEIVGKIVEFGNRIAKAFEPATDKLRELFSILEDQSGGYGFATLLTQTFVSLSESIGSACGAILAVLNPVIEALDIPELVFEGLWTLNDLFKALDDVFESLTPGLELFSKNGLAPIAESLNSGLTDGMQHLRDLFDDLGQWFEDNEEQLTEFMGELGRTVGELWKAFEPFQSAVVSLFWSETEEAIGDLGRTASESLPPITDALRMFNDALAKLNGTGFFEAEAQVWKDIFAIVKGIVTLDFGGHFDRLSELGNSLSALGDTIREGIGDIVSENFPNLWEAIVDGGDSQKILDGVLKDLSQSFSEVKDDVVGFFTDAWDSIKEIWETVAEWFDTNVVTPLKKVFPGLESWLSKPFSTAYGNTTHTWGSAKTWFTGSVNNPLSMLFTKTGTGISGSFTGAKQTSQSVWSTVNGWFGANVKTPISGTFSGLQSNIQNAFSSAKNGVMNAWGNISNWFTKNVKNPITSIFSGHDWRSIGSTAANALKNGFGSIRMPKFHFNWVWSYKSISILGKTFGMNIPWPNISFYQGGGFPVSGQLFMARENGIPEMVGQMGGRTAVANNDQIVDGIRRGVYEAQMEQNALLREEIALLRQLLAKESTAVAQVTTSDIVNGISRKNRRDGRVVVPVGT